MGKPIQAGPEFLLEAEFGGYPVLRLGYVQGLQW